MSSKQQRINALTAAARRKSEAKVRNAEAGIKRLIKRGEAVTFQAVQREANVSQNFLYTNAGLRARIEHQRQIHRPQVNTQSTPDGESNIVMALTAQVARLKKTHRQEVAELRRALEEAHGENLSLRRELERRGTGNR
jgi:hypothetical protein